MMNILEEFLNGNIQPNDRYFCRGSKYGQAIKKLSDAEHALRAALNEQETELLNAYVNAQEKIDYLSGTDRFIYGYRLGVLMTMEVFRTSDEIIVSGENE